MADLKLAVLVLFLCIQLSVSLTKVKYCSIAADCNDTQCCVSINQPKGRRKRQIDGNLPGTCQPMGGQGDKCYVNAGASSTPPPDLTYSCPCQSPLTCVGSGMSEIPLGEVGICG